MNIFDQLAERQIQQAIEQGQLDDLPGAGQPLILEDESQVPDDLRAGYHLLKNAGFIPPELAERQEAIKLCDLIETLDEQSSTTKTAQECYQKLQQLELKLRIKGVNTHFIHRFLHRQHKQLTP